MINFLITIPLILLNFLKIYLGYFQIININLHSNAQLREALSQIGSDTVMEVDKKTVKDLKKLKYKASLLYNIQVLFEELKLVLIFL